MTAVEEPAVAPRVVGPVTWVALVILYVVWGSTYLAIRVVVHSAPPLLAAGGRFALAGALLGGVLALRGGTGRIRVGPRELLGCTVLGLLLPLGGNGLVTLAERTVPSGIAALLVSAIPLWVVLLRAATGDRVGRATVVGVFVGFAGIAVLSDPRGGASAGGVATLLLASLLWSLGSWGQARLPLPADPFVLTAYEMLTGGVALVTLGLARGESPADLAGAHADAWWALGYLVVFGSLVAFTAYVWLLQTAPISLVATYAYVNPAVAVGLGALVLGERVTSRVALGGAVVIGSVALVVRAEARARRAARTAQQLSGAGLPAGGEGSAPAG